MVVRSVDVVSVIRLTFSLGLVVWAVVLVGLVALYFVGLVSGGLGGVEGFIASLGFTGFRVAIVPFLLLAAVAGVLTSAVMAGLAAVLTLLYNALTPIVGGVEIGTRGGAERR
jgi:hypothetical protein